jgi:hypothetical protein
VFISGALEYWITRFSRVTTSEIVASAFQIYCLLSP